MQLTHPALEAVTTAPTSLASFINEKRHEEMRKSQAKHGGNKTNISGYIEQSATFIQSFEKSRNFAYM